MSLAFQVRLWSIVVLMILPRLGTFAKRHWFLLALGVVVLLGLVRPEEAEALLQLPVVFSLLVGLALFVSSLSLDVRRMGAQARNWRAIALALSSIYGMAPLLGYGLARLLDPAAPGASVEGHRFLEAVMLAAAQAGTLTSAFVLTGAARGDQELALVLTVASNLLTALITPWVLELSLGVVVSLPVWEMMGRMALVVLFPVLLGQAARALLLPRIAAWLKWLRYVPQAIILVFVYCGFGSASRQIIGGTGWAGRLFALALALHAALLGWNYLVSRLLRLPAPARIAVVFCGSQKTLPNSIYLWNQFFHSNPYGALAAVLYHLIQLVGDSVLVPYLARRPSPEGQ